MKHSKLGIISCVIFAGVALCALVIVAIFALIMPGCEVGCTRAGGFAWGMLGIGLGMVAWWASVVGALLGIIGLFQRQCRRDTALAGFFLNSLFAAITAAVVMTMCAQG